MALILFGAPPHRLDGEGGSVSSAVADLEARPPAEGDDGWWRCLRCGDAFPSDRVFCWAGPDCPVCPHCGIDGATRLPLSAGELARRVLEYTRWFGTVSGVYRLLGADPPGLEWMATHAGVVRVKLREPDGVRRVLVDLSGPAPEVRGAFWADGTPAVLDAGQAALAVAKAVTGESQPTVVRSGTELEHLVLDGGAAEDVDAALGAVLAVAGGEGASAGGAPPWRWIERSSRELCDVVARCVRWELGPEHPPLVRPCPRGGAPVLCRVGLLLWPEGRRQVHVGLLGPELVGEEEAWEVLADAAAAVDDPLGPPSARPVEPAVAALAARTAGHPRCVSRGQLLVRTALGHLRLFPQADGETVRVVVPQFSLQGPLFHPAMFPGEGPVLARLGFSPVAVPAAPPLRRSSGEPVASFGERAEEPEACWEQVVSLARLDALVEIFASSVYQPPARETYVPVELGRTCSMWTLLDRWPADGPGAALDLAFAGLVAAERRAEAALVGEAEEIAGRAVWRWRSPRPLLAWTDVVARGDDGPRVVELREGAVLACADGAFTVVAWQRHRPSDVAALLADAAATRSVAEDPGSSFLMARLPDVD